MNLEMSEKLQFQTLHPFQPSSTKYTKNIRYNAIDCRAGLLASIAKNDVNFYNISSYERASIKSVDLKDKLVSVDPIFSIKFQLNVAWIEFNCDGSILLVALVTDDDRLATIRLLHVEKSLLENKESILCEYKPNTESQLVDLRWHPNEKESFLMVLNDTVSLCCVKDSKIDIINQKSNAFCVSWSPKGKQFSVVLKNDNSDGFVINQYDNLMNEKRSTAIKDINSVFKVQANLVPLELCWYSTFNFIIGFRGSTPSDGQSKIYACNFATKTLTIQDLFEVKSSDSCISNAMPRARLYFMHILEWNIIALLNNSAEDLHFYKYDKDNMEHFKSFCLPIDGNAIGFCSDFTSNQVLPEKWLSPYDGENNSRFPILLFKLSNSDCTGIYLIQSLKPVEKDTNKMKILNDVPNLDSCDNQSDTNTGSKTSLFASNWETSSDFPGSVSDVSRTAPIIESAKPDLSNKSKPLGNQSGDSILFTKPAENQTTTNIFAPQTPNQSNINIGSAINSANKIDLFGTKSFGNTNIFSTKNTENQPGTSVFGNKSQPIQTQNLNIFGSQNIENQSGTNLFGNKSSDNSSTVNQKSSIFGTQTTKNQSSTNIFGQESQSKSGVKNQASSMSFGSQSTESRSNNNIFGNQTDSNALNSNHFDESKSDGKFDSHNFTNQTNSNLYNFPKDKSNKPVESKVMEHPPSISSSNTKTKKSEMGGKSPREKVGSVKIEKEDSLPKSHSQKQASGDHENASVLFSKSNIESKKDATKDRTIVKSTKTNFNKDKGDITDHILSDALRTLEDGIKEIKITTYGLINKSREFFNSDKMKEEVPKMIKDVDQYYVYLNKLTLHNDETIINCRALFQDIDITSEFTSRFKATILDSKVRNKHFPSLPNPLLKKKSMNINEQYVKVNSRLKDLEEILDDYENKRQCKKNKNNKSFQVNNIFEILKSNSKEISLERSKVDLIKEHLRDIKEEPIEFNHPKASYLKMQSVPVEMERRLHHLMCRRTVKVLPCQFSEIKSNIPFNQDSKSANKMSNRKTQEPIKKDTNLTTPESQKAPINIIPKNAYKSPVNKESQNSNEPGHPSITVSFSKTPSSNQFNLSSNANKASMPTTVPYSLSSQSTVSPFCFSISKAAETNLMKNLDNKPLTSFTNIKTETLVTKATDTVVIQGKNAPTSTLLFGDDNVKSNEIKLTNKTNIIPTLFKPQMSKPNDITSSTNVPVSISPISTTPVSTIPSSEQMKFVSANNTVTSGLFSTGLTSISQGNGGIFSSPGTVSNLTIQSTSFNQGLFGKSVATSPSTSGTISTTKPSLESLQNMTVTSQPGLFSSPTSNSSVTSKSTNLFATPSINKSTGLFGTSSATSQTGMGLFSTPPLNVTSSQSKNLFLTETKSNESLNENSIVTTIQTGCGLFSSTTTSTLSTAALSTGLFGVSSNTSSGINVTSSQSSGLFRSPITSKTSLSVSSSSSPITTTNVSQSPGLFDTDKTNGGLFGNSPVSINTTQSSELFGQTQSSKPSGGLFGNSPVSTSTTQSSALFGQNQSNKPSGGLFGNSPVSTSTTQSFGLFGQTQSSSPSGGLFGKSPVSTSTTQSSGLFGQTQSSSPSGGLFGNSPVSTSTTQSSGLFGQTQSNKPSGGLFGNSSVSTSTTQSFGLFGQTQSSNPSGGLFGNSPVSTSTTQSSELFGQTQSNKPSGGLFENSSVSTSTTQSGLFGQSQSSNPSGGLFGNSPVSNSTTQSSGLFGQTQSSKPSGGLFGNPQMSTSVTQSNGLFGQTTSSKPSGGLFGNAPVSSTTSQPTGLFAQTQPGQPTGGLFGNSSISSNTPQSNGLFGQSSSGKPSGGLFGNSPVSSTTTQSTGLFGSTLSSQSTGLFGNTVSQAQTGGGLFSSTNTTNQSSGIFGSPKANNTQSSGGLFGQSVSTPTQSSGLFGTNKPPATGNLFGNSAAKSPGSGLFGNNTQISNSSLFASSNSNSQSTNLFASANNKDSQMTTMDSSGLAFGSCSLGGAVGNQTSNKSTNIFASVNTNDSAAKSINLFAPNNQSGNLFNTTKQNSLFATNTTSPANQQSSLFGSRPVFGNTNENTAQQSSVQSGGLFSSTIFGNSNDNSSHMSFGEVATNNENRPGFGTNPSGSLFPTTSPSFTQRRM